MPYALLRTSRFRSLETTSCLLKASTTHSACDHVEAKEWLLPPHAVRYEKKNDVYMYSAMWLVFVTSTTVGYGDIIPTTHLSRAVAAVSGLIGIVSASLITASLANEMTFTLAEQSATALMNREVARNNLVTCAANIISYWYRRKVGKKMTRRQAKFDPYRMMLEFRRLKRATLVEVEDCAGTGAKIDIVAHKITRVCRVMDAVGHKIWGGDAAVLDLVEMQMSAQRTVKSEKVKVPKISMKGLTKLVFTTAAMHNSFQKRHSPDGKDVELQGEAAKKEVSGSFSNISTTMKKRTPDSGSDGKEVVGLVRRSFSAPDVAAPAALKVGGACLLPCEPGTRLVWPLKLELSGCWCLVWLLTLYLSGCAPRRIVIGRRSLPNSRGRAAMAAPARRLPD